MHPILDTIAPIISTASAPAVLVNVHRWFWVAVLACGLAAAIAAFTTHFLAAIKFAFAGIAGGVLNWLYGIVIGSFVLSGLACFACGLVVAWYILNGRHQFEPNSLVKNLNNRLGSLETQIAQKFSHEKQPSSPGV